MRFKHLTLLCKPPQLFPQVAIASLAQYVAFPYLFLLDNGATVTLLKKDIWTETSTRSQKTLKLWSVVKLVGAPLTVHGLASLEFELGFEKFSMDVIVVIPLTQKQSLVSTLFCLSSKHPLAWLAGCYTSE